jgi:hypothetical protein
MAEEDGSKDVTRKLNDEFRRSMNPELGKCVMTRGVVQLPELERIAVIQKTKFYKDFTEANDPHGEHDFGSFEVRGQKCYFKIDYYDESLEFGSEDPSDPEKTTRVLTLMLANEY